ncbi:GNAT family N-acetyltransferase [Dyella caseinilytica]|uniref:GNAT family N-acetyltransferase n=1 Tax=Dyella caseinilytica TaxID=1849581 RepID=A0ABX7GUF9_9GAMM|nr:GNAT family protein [Dyella caseinilytica]QRN53598.1 GNAT family N-acetyltransferase [Dyella caseinilytica]
MITLDPIPLDDLVALSKSSIPTRLVGIALEGALPPAFVATRSLDHIDSGKSVHWCSTFYIRDLDKAVVGGCGFKDEPHNGRVEIGYAVSPERRNQGIATVAIEALTSLAFKSAEVHEVLAQVSELNAPSTRVVQKLGFVNTGTAVDKDDEVLVQWILRAQPNPSKTNPKDAMGQC